MISADLAETFRVLAQSNGEMVLYLPGYQEDLLYRRSDEGGFVEDVREPSKVVGLTCMTALEDLRGAVRDEDLGSLMSEIGLVVAMMIDMPMLGHYLWMIDKERYLISGPYDDSWAILRRLASLGLKMIGQDVQPPRSSFGEFVKLGGFSRWKVVPTPVD